MSESAAFPTPTGAQIHLALARLTTLQLRRAFYAKLANPNWVTPLASAGVFDQPPPLIKAEDGTVRADPWPEVEYLARVAAQAPTEVSAVLAPILATDNPWVRRSMVEAMAEMSPEAVRPLAAGVEKWAESPYTPYFDFRKLADVISGLLRGSRAQARAGRRLANAFYQPQESRGQTSLGISTPHIPMDSYWYADTVADVVDAMGPKGMWAAQDWLEAFQLHSGRFNPEEQTDYSEMWRPTIDMPLNRPYREVEDSLVNATRRAAKTAMQDDPAAAITRLRRSAQPLVRRILLDVLAEQLEESSSGGQPASPEVRRAAAELIELPGIAEEGLRVEYIRFVRACLLHSDVVESSAFDRVVEAGPRHSVDDVIAMELKWRPDADVANVRQRSEERLARWIHRLLSQIGHQHLSPTLQARLDELVAQFGAIEDPTPRNQNEVASIARPVAISPAIDVAGLSAADLVAFISDWRPPVDTSLIDYHDLAREVGNLIQAEPESFAGGESEMLKLSPIFLRGVLEGWRRAVEDGLDVPWALALDVSKELLTPSQRVPADHIEDRCVGSEATGTARFWVSALENCGPGRDRELPEEVRVEVAPILRDIAATVDPGAYGAEPRMSDPLSASLNYPRPIAVRALTRLLMWSQPTDLRLAILDQLAALPGENPTDPETAAVLGESIGRLVNEAADWLRTHGEEIFGSADSFTPFQQVSCTTALATHHPHPKLLDVLRPTLLAVMAGRYDAEPMLGWKGHRSFGELIGDWIVGGIASGALEIDDELVSTFYAWAPPSTRGSSIGHLAWSMTQADSIDPAVVDRVMRLWDIRVAYVREAAEDAAEMADFYWFVRCTAFPPEWWLPRLAEVATRYEDFNPRGMLAKHLANAALVDTDAALTVLEQLVEHREKQDQWDQYDLVQNAAPDVLAAGLASSDSGIRARADELMNLLGALGHLDMEQRVNGRLAHMAQHGIERSKIGESQREIG